jgi:hypothetical protein
LLHGGLAKCGECSSTLEPHTQTRRRKDGSQLVVYRCSQSTHHGRDQKGCRGVTISAEALDYAVITTLDENLGRAHFLANIFAAWDRDLEAANSNIHAIEAALADHRERSRRGTARLLTLELGDSLAASLEMEIRMLNEGVRGLEERLRKAQEAVNTARNNPALRDELAQWFDAWLVGFWELPTDKQRDFLFAIGAEVRLWREGEHQPSRAQLRVGLPVETGVLPPPPDTIDVRDDAIAASLRYADWIRGGGYFDMEPAPADTRPKPLETAEEVMQAVQDELWAQTHEWMMSEDDPDLAPDSSITFNSAPAASPGTLADHPSAKAPARAAVSARPPAVLRPMRSNRQ